MLGSNKEGSGYGGYFLKQLSQYASKIIRPPVIFKLILTAVSAVLLGFTFAHGIEHTVIAYVSYVVSAYTLTVIIAGMPVVFRKGRYILASNRYSSRIINDLELRTRLSLYFGLFINMVYAMFKLSTGIMYRSSWFISIAAYYFILGIIKFLLLLGVRTSSKAAENDRKKRSELRYCRSTGLLLLALDLAMAAITVNMILRDKRYQYPGMVIYVSAGYTLYRLIASTINVIKYRKISNPLMSAAKALDFATALMAIFALQTAMLTKFGGAGIYVAVFNSLTGGIVCFSVLLIAVYVIIKASIDLKKYKIIGT